MNIASCTLPPAHGRLQIDIAVQSLNLQCKASIWPYSLKTSVNSNYIEVKVISMLTEDEILAVNGGNPIRHIRPFPGPKWSSRKFIF
jgi:hypothetical protein